MIKEIEKTMNNLPKYSTREFEKLKEGMLFVFKQYENTNLLIMFTGYFEETLAEFKMIYPTYYKYSLSFSKKYFEELINKKRLVIVG